MTTTPKTEPELVELMARGPYGKEQWGWLSSESKKIRLGIIRTGLANLGAAGLTVVPREATADMYERGCEVDDVDWVDDLNLSDSDVSHQTVNIGKIWDAMRDAGRITGDGG